MHFARSEALLEQVDEVVRREAALFSDLSVREADRRQQVLHGGEFVTEDVFPRVLGVETSDMHAWNERVRVASIGEYAELIEGFS